MESLPAQYKPLGGPTRGSGERRSPERFVELDALRGIAAMIVVLFHFSIQTVMVAHQAHSRTVFLIRPFIAGREAVILFFLLSGFVLSLSTWKGVALPYSKYVVRRVCRIYLPYLAALALAVGACAVFQHFFSTPAWPDRPWPEPPTLSTVLHHVGFIGEYDDRRYNGAFWTLVIEMRVSLVFPFVLMALTRLRAWVAILAALTISMTAIGLVVLYPASAWSRYRHGLYNFHYLAFFIVGAILARGLTRRPSAPIHAGLRHAMVPLSILLFSYGARLSQFVPTWSFGVTGMLTDWPVALGGVGLIYLAATHRTVKRTLGHFIPRYLGHISYSLYLVHTVILGSLLIFFHNRISIAAVFPLYIGLSIAVASLCHYAIERPAMRLGRRLTRDTAKAISI
ncbi:MAG TPA: acyltransferase [Acidisarcina sp.]